MPAAIPFAMYWYSILLAKEKFVISYFLFHSYLYLEVLINYLYGCDHSTAYGFTTSLYICFYLFNSETPGDKIVTEVLNFLTFTFVNSFYMFKNNEK